MYTNWVFPNDLFDHNKNIHEAFKETLVEGFEEAELECENSQGIGNHRERVIIGSWKYLFGDRVRTVDNEINKEYDVIVDNMNVSIKTVKNNGMVKVSWTSNYDRILDEVKAYVPDSDIFLTNVYWGRKNVKESIFFIPKQVQCDILDDIGHENYLKIPSQNSNPRGFGISTSAMKMLKQHELTLQSIIDWQRKYPENYDTVETKSMNRMKEKMQKFNELQQSI